MKIKARKKYVVNPNREYELCLKTKKEIQSKEFLKGQAVRGKRLQYSETFISYSLEMSEKKGIFSSIGFRSKC